MTNSKVLKAYMQNKVMSIAEGHPLPVGTEDLVIHPKMYPIADKYFVKCLQVAAREMFE